MGLGETLRRMLRAVAPGLFRPGAFLGPKPLGPDEMPDFLIGRPHLSARLIGANRGSFRPDRVFEVWGPIAPCTFILDVQPTGKHKGGPRIGALVQGIGLVGRLDGRGPIVHQDFTDAVIAGARSGWVAIHRGRSGGLDERFILPGTAPEHPVEWDPSRIVHDSFTSDRPGRDGMPEHGMTRKLPTGRRIQVTGEEAVAENLEHWLADRERWAVVVSLWTHRLDGSSDGRVWVWLFDQEIGCLGEVSSRRVRGAIEAIEAEGLTPVADAEVVRRKGKVEVVVSVGSLDGWSADPGEQQPPR